MSGSWNAMSVLANDYWEIDIVTGTFDTKMEAEAHAEHARVDAEFVRQDNEYGLMVTVNNGDKRFYRDNDITIKEVSAEKRKAMGKPIDVTDKESVQIMLDSFLSGNTDYVIEPDDMVVSDKKISDLIAMHGVGFRPDDIAWFVEQTHEHHEEA